MAMHNIFIQGASNECYAKALDPEISREKVIWDAKSSKKREKSQNNTSFS